MGLVAQLQILPVHAAPVVQDSDAADTAALDVQVDAVRSGIDSIIEQFPDHRKRPVDNLAGRNFLGY